MAMGRRKPQQPNMFLPAARGGGHRFYEALNKLLGEAGFDEFAEKLCEPYYGDDDKPGRPSLVPGIYFRMLFIGYFEGIGSERGIAWRCADSISLRDFLGIPLHLPTPDQSTVSRTRRRLPLDVFRAVFEKALGIVDEKGLLKGRVRGVDSTYLKADASMKGIVRKDTGEPYGEYIKRVTAEDQEAASRQDKSDDDGTSNEAGGSADATSTRSDANTPAPESSSAQSEPESDVVTKPNVTAEEAVRHDRRRKKTTSNKDWQSPVDPEARIVRMKNGTTRLGYKPEHVVDMETGVILAAEVFLGDEHDASTLERSLAAAEKHLAALHADDVVDETALAAGESWHKEPIAEVVADKGYHKVSTLLALKEQGYRTYIPERKQRGRRKFVDKGGHAAAQAFHGNRARTLRAKGKAHQRRRGEMLERPNQHLYCRTGTRNLTLRGREEIQKRVSMLAAAFNLGAVLRKALGAGAPKWLAVLAGRLAAFWMDFCDFQRASARSRRAMVASILRAATKAIGSASF
jgi:transposase